MEIADDKYNINVGDLVGYLLNAILPTLPEVVSLPTSMAEERVRISRTATHTIENAITLDYFVGALTDEDTSIECIACKQIKGQEEYMKVKAEIELSHGHFVTSI